MSPILHLKMVLCQNAREFRYGVRIALIGVVVIEIVVVATTVVLNNSPAKAVVQAYYAAVEKQDYATAYTYLDIQTMSHDGQQYPATQALYIHVSQ